MVAFRLAKNSSEHQGLYRGLNEIMLNGHVLLGDAVKAEIPPELAYDTVGLDRYYNVEGGFIQGAIQNEHQMAAPNNPNAPASHQNRNPLCLAYVAVPPDSTIDLELEVMQINHHRREIREMTIGECLCTGISSAFGCNGFGERQRL